MSAGRVITFYSYKGGVGRTQALASIGTLLSRWGYKVLCVDWDLEAPGLDRYFQKWLGETRSAGVVELIHAHVDEKSPHWQDYVVPLQLGGAAQSLHLMPAGLQDDSYKRRIQSLDWGVLYEKHGLGAFLEQLRNEWKSTYDFVLIDSRTGITDIGGICTIQLPDQLVLLFTANHQSLEGIVDVWRSALAGRNDFPFDRGHLLALPVATRFELRVEYERAQDWLKTFAKLLEPIYMEWARESVSVQELLHFTRIPYVPYWSFGEDLPVLEEDGRDPEQISYAFETLAALIAKGLDESDLLVGNRDSYVSAACKVKPPAAITDVEPQRKPVRLFLSYSFKDHRLVSEFMAHLAVLERQGVITTWHERMVSPGEQWKRELDMHIEDADIILLFLSADFLGSEYIQGAELKRALQLQKEANARVVPILLRPVLWEQTLFAQMQVLPRNGLPVTRHDDTEEVWAECSREISLMAQAIRNPTTKPAQERTRLGAPSFQRLDSMLSGLSLLAESSGCRSDMAVKDVAVGPEDSAPLNISRADLKNIIRECSVELQGWGGDNFPYGWHSESKEVHIPQGIRVVDTSAGTFSTESFHLWEMQFTGHLIQRQDIEEDNIETSPGERSPHGHLSVEWALRDIVRPLLFARKLIDRIDYTGRFAAKYRWFGLKERSLTILDRKRWGLTSGRYVSHLPTWDFECVIKRDADLYEAAYNAAQSLFWQFGWERAMEAYVVGQIRTLLEGRYQD
jgi:MinD-like ATPase involved in chromosome partitioning or flagellar assembly